MAKKSAVIDLGSNSLRMGIFQLEDGKIVQTERFREQVRISEGLVLDNLLKEEPVKRTLSALKKFKNILDEKGIVNIKMVATEALRRAKNSSGFIAQVKSRFGIDVEIIDGLNEARYDVIAAKTSVSYKDFYMIDTGGGSVEIALVLDGEVKDACCLPLGSVVMTEKFKPDEFGAEQMEKFLQTEFFKTGIIKKNGLPVVALGGSNKELAKISLEFEREIDGYKIKASDSKKIYESLKAQTLMERKEVKGLDPKRADTIIAGLWPMVSLVELCGAEEISFCTGSVREGVAAEMLYEK